MRYGIMGAMPEEIDLLVKEVYPTPVERSWEGIVSGSRTYFQGMLWNNHVSLVASGWGKVAAASATTTLIDRFNVNAVIFVGVAGSLTPSVKTGDVVIGFSLYQHDMDASPFYEPCVIPGLGMAAIPSDVELRGRAVDAARNFLPGRAILGDIASGDWFIDDEVMADCVKEACPSALCVDMESAAVAQVCHEHKVPFVVIRVISDNADHSAPVDFPKFVKETAAVYSYEILKRMLKGDSE